MRSGILTNATLKGCAYAGTYVVVLAWDFVSSAASNRKNLLGFAIERIELKPDGTVLEKYWMKGIKRFKDKDIGLAAGTPVPTSEHPFQSFQWCDYTAKHDRDYQFRIVPAYGTSKLIELREANSLTISIRTEAEMGDVVAAANNQVRHDVYFNRGVIGSQAYAREFKNATPNVNEPFSKEMKWLSRGLFEGLLHFIALAKDEHYKLRAAFYEFKYLPVATAFATVAEAGADVMIVYDGESSYKVENKLTIEAAGLDMIDAVKARTVSEGIRHNKFIVLIKDDVPVAVWTGSTNISASGIFGHSNVGHIVWDQAIATAYLGYWDLLHQNLTCTKLRPLNKAATPTPAGKPPKNSIVPLFSARDDDDDNSTLQWYADIMDGAKKIMCITFAFNVDLVFQSVIQKENDVLRYIVKDDNLGGDEIIGQDKDVIFASGGYFGYNSLFNFREERDNPLSSNDYIHDKFMLVDPLGSDPIVITGSANFSRPSQRINDENMLVIRGDTRLADIYFGEFMRIFDHHYARYISRILQQANKNDPNAGYLSPDDTWTKSHFDSKSYKSKRRKYFIN